MLTLPAVIPVIQDQRSIMIYLPSYNRRADLDEIDFQNIHYWILDLSSSIVDQPRETANTVILYFLNIIIFTSL